MHKCIYIKYIYLDARHDATHTRLGATAGVNELSQELLRDIIIVMTAHQSARPGFKYFKCILMHS